MTRTEAIQGWIDAGQNVKQLADFGLVRLGKRKTLFQDKETKIILTDGVDGFGRSTCRYAVVKLVRDDNSLDGWRREDSVGVYAPEQWVYGISCFAHSDKALTPIALTADIDAATASLQRKSVSLNIDVVAPKLKQLRERASLTVEALAEKSGISKAAIHQIEQGRRANPSLDTIRKLCAALDASLAEFD